MPADPESTGWIAGMLAAMGLGGGVPLIRLHTSLSDHGARLKHLEDREKAHDKKIDATHTTVTRLDERTATTDDNVKSILEWVRERD